MKFYLTTKALKDLKDIALYTEEKWGIKQRNIYLDKMDKVFHKISKNPHRGKSCNHLRQGYFKLLIEKHIIFYKIDESEIEIIRILHQSMDISTHIN